MLWKLKESMHSWVGSKAVLVNNIKSYLFSFYKPSLALEFHITNTFIHRLLAFPAALVWQTQSAFCLNSGFSNQYPTFQESCIMGKNENDIAVKFEGRKIWAFLEWLRMAADLTIWVQCGMLLKISFIFSKK